MENCCNNIFFHPLYTVLCSHKLLKKICFETAPQEQNYWHDYESFLSNTATIRPCKYIFLDIISLTFKVFMFVLYCTLKSNNTQMKHKPTGMIHVLFNHSKISLYFCNILNTVHDNLSLLLKGMTNMWQLYK